MIFRLLPISSLLLTMQIAWGALECKIEIVRKACPGQEADAFASTNGKALSHEVEQLDSKDSCLAFAKKRVVIVRKDKLASKAIKVWVNGEEQWQEFTDRSSCRRFDSTVL